MTTPAAVEPAPERNPSYHQQAPISHDSAKAVPVYINGSLFGEFRKVCDARNEYAVDSISRFMRYSITEYLKANGPVGDVR